MANHTPGPWKVDHELNDMVLDSSGDYIAKTMPSMEGDEEQANRRLIAAAPDMLKQLKKCKEFIKNGVKCGMIELPPPPDPALNRLEEVEKIIAKAEGDADE